MKYDHRKYIRFADAIYQALNAPEMRSAIREQRTKYKRDPRPLREVLGIPNNIRFAMSGKIKP